MKILIINSGSSSLKFQLMDPQTGEVFAKGLCERIGIDGAFTFKVPGRPDRKENTPIPDHATAVRLVLSALLDKDTGVISDVHEIAAVGHRVAHGGEAFKHSVLVTDGVLAQIKAYGPLAPLHNPANAMGIEACREVLGPDIPQIAGFDTAFHQTMPPVAYMYALPKKFYEENQVRRYGFHGLSHRYVTQRAAEMLGRPIEELKLISCHLGNGSSIAAVNRGVSVDTSMGFTPLGGLPMGTRSGDLDPAILEYLMRIYNLDIDGMLSILNRESGVLGISDQSPDFRDLCQSADVGNDAALAVDKFAYEVKKFIGAYIAAMDGLDALIFTAGIGENSPEVRMNICSGLDSLGVKIDYSKNRVHGAEADISSADSKVRVLVIPTNEELVIAKDAMEILASLS